MNEYQIDSINKPHRLSPHEHIIYLGNNTYLWKLSREAVIRRIDAKQEKYYTFDETTSVRIYIGVVRGDGNKAPYLRTYADGKWNDNLLALPECNPSCRILE